MKIPFLLFHIVSEQVLLEKEQMSAKLDVLRLLTSPFIPNIEQLITARHEAMIGREAYGRRKAQRKVAQAASSLRVGIETAQCEETEND